MNRIGAVRAIATMLEPYWFRGKGRLMRAICPRHGLADRHLYGAKIQLDLSDWIQRSIFLGVYEPPETQRLKKYLTPGMVFVDVGANIGYYTLLAQQAVGASGRVIAIEPSPRAASKLRDATQGIDTVTVVQAAVGARSGRATLFVDEAAGNHTPTLVAHDANLRTEVTVTTLDECVAAGGVENIDLLKVDVEGWEPQVLAGAQHLLGTRRIRAIMCEFNTHWLEAAGSSPAALWNTIVGWGFVDSESPQTTPDFRGGIDTRFFLLTDSRASAGG